VRFNPDCAAAQARARACGTTAAGRQSPDAWRVYPQPASAHSGAAANSPRIEHCCTVLQHFASERASPNPRLTPCPARGCTTCAASPISATRVAPSCATQGPSAERRPARMTSSCPTRHTRPRQPACTVRHAAAKRARRMRVAGGPDHRYPVPRQGQKSQHAIRAEPLQAMPRCGFSHAKFATTPFSP